MIQSSIYFGEVLHSRSHPKKHSFKYKYRSLFNKNIYDFKLKKFNKFKFSFSSYDFNDELLPIGASFLSRIAEKTLGKD